MIYFLRMVPPHWEQWAVSPNTRIRTRYPHDVHTNQSPAILILVKISGICVLLEQHLFIVIPPIRF